jgi:hypothetical protein
MLPEVLAPSESNPMGEEKALGMELIVVRDDVRMNRVIPETVRGIDSPYLLR